MPKDFLKFRELNVTCLVFYKHELRQEALLVKVSRCFSKFNLHFFSIFCGISTSCCATYMLPWYQYKRLRAQINSCLLVRGNNRYCCKPQIDAFPTPTIWHIHPFTTYGNLFVLTNPFFLLTSYEVLSGNNAKNSKNAPQHSKIS